MTGLLCEWCGKREADARYDCEESYWRRPKGTKPRMNHYCSMWCMLKHALDEQRQYFLLYPHKKAEFNRLQAKAAEQSRVKRGSRKPSITVGPDRVLELDD